MDKDVPLLIPEVNHQHLGLLDRQRGTYARGGFIVTNPNCSTIMLALALAPLHASFGIEATVATTLQALSGAGYPGVASLDILDNVLPYIGGEEEKIETETTKLLGRFSEGRIDHAPMAVSAQCHRVNVMDGHMAAVRVKFARDVENIVAVKEASGNLSQIMEILRGRPENFRVISGDDALTLAMIALGAEGLISVASNEAPELMSQLNEQALAGNWDEARALHYKLLPLMEGNFIESSPGPVKAALAMMGLIEEKLRLPLVPVQEKTRARLREILVEIGLLKESSHAVA
jgi:hypothetical protein